MTRHVFRRLERGYLVVSMDAGGYDFRGMIKAVLLIFEPVPTWERIVAAQRKWSSILLGHLLPLLLLACAVEGYGLFHWGKPRGKIPHIQALTLPETLVFEGAQLLLSFGIIFLSAKLLKALGETFHGRHSLRETFTVAAYALSPLFLLRTIDAFPSVSPWTPWAIGIALSAAVLYHGLPRVMQPDPPHAFGLYIMGLVILLIITGLGCFLTTWYLQGRFTKLDAIVSQLLNP
jgi:Yip1 domain